MTDPASADSRPLEQREFQAKDRASAPQVAGAAWRECACCAGADRLTHARRLVAAATGEYGLATADLLADWAAPALAAMPWPTYAAHPSCAGPRDAGTEQPYGFYNADFWAAELARQIEQHRPPEPGPSPNRLPCQVCGVSSSTGWDVLHGDPLCAVCTAQFAPKPPVNARDPHASRPADRRPIHHPRGRWDLTWDLAPAPDDWQHLPTEQQLRKEAQIRICDRDLICAAAAFRPQLARPGLAREVGFGLAREHPHYRHSPAWHEPFGYLADNPHAHTRDTLVDAVARLAPQPDRAPQVQR